MSRLSTWFRSRSKLRPRWRADLDEHVIDLAWSPSGRFLGAASVGGPIGVFETKDGSTHERLAGHGFGTTALAWLSDSILVTAGQDGKVRWWNLDAGSELHVAEGGSNWVEILAPSPDRSSIVTGAGRHLRLWDQDGTLLREYPIQSSTISTIRWRPGSPEFVTAGYGGMSVWSPERDDPVRRFEWKGSILSIACSPDGHYLATGNQDSTVHFWYYESGEELQMWGYPTKIRELAWDRTSRLLATGGGSQVTVWNCSGKGPSGTKPLSLIGHDEEELISVLTYQSRGDTLASGGTDGRVILWNPHESLKPVAVYQMNAAVTALTWAVDERVLAAATADGEINLLIG